MTVLKLPPAIPETITVYGVPYTVTTSERITDSDTGDNLDGQVSYNLAHIEIVDGMPLEVERRVVLHEILHTIFLHSGHSNYRRDEDLVEALSHGMVHLLQTNPALVDYLVK